MDQGIDMKGVEPSGEALELAGESGVGVKVDRESVTAALGGAVLLLLWICCCLCILPLGLLLGPPYSSAVWAIAGGVILLSAVLDYWPITRERGGLVKGGWIHMVIGVTLGLCWEIGVFNTEMKWLWFWSMMGYFFYHWAYVGRLSWILWDGSKWVFWVCFALACPGMWYVIAKTQGKEEELLFSDLVGMGMMGLWFIGWLGLNLSFYIALWNIRQTGWSGGTGPTVQTIKVKK